MCTHIVNKGKTEKKYFSLKTVIVYVLASFLPAFMCTFIINSCNHLICTFFPEFSHPHLSKFHVSTTAIIIVNFSWYLLCSM